MRNLTLLVANALAVAALALIAAPPSHAQDLEHEGPRLVPSCDSAVTDRLGPHSNATLPRYASIRANEANLRRGPDFDHAIDWVIRLENLPVCIISEVDGWRRVELPTGERGWMNASLLSDARFAVFLDAPGALWPATDLSGDPVATIAPLTPLPLLSCTAEWCEIDVEPGPIFVLRSEIWGVRPIEQP